MIGRPSVRDAAFGCAHRLIRKSLKPQDPRKDHAGSHLLVALEANDMRLLGNRVIASEHVLETAPRAGVVAQVIL